ncbi:ubinuclein-1-like isoform X2 [Ipomoea triloba]|uniref:ubinuclein-1-like isoform X2 n=1 Tax=Ipomoea triloba TaxID=35885 RepID=UPI00125D80AE|nr:ubinuclein-1-like isoform X2 [Ipomoea triloba]
MDEPGTGGGGESAGGKFSTSYEESAGRQRFKVKLTPGETTIVSWKKLLKDATGSHSRRNAVSDPAPSSSAAAAANQPLDSHIAPEVKDAPPGNRLNAVIEKIERLYVGKHSDDEEDLSDVPDEDEYDTEDSFIDDTELDEYFEVDNSAIKHDGFFVNRGNLERIEPTSLQIQLPEKRRRKDQAKGHSGSDGFIPNKLAKVAKDTGKPVPDVAGASGLPYSGVMLDLHHENDSPNITNGLHQSLQGGEKSVGHDERLNTGPPEAKSSIQPVRREASSVRRKGTMLEKAIRDLEKIVAESRPPNTDVQEADNSSQAIKRRLPLEIKHKLAKVARLAASHGKVSDELVNRLMSIVGHLIQLRTLKRNLKAMINMGLSAKQEKDDRVQQIKAEVADMIRTRIPPAKSKTIEQEDRTMEDFQDVIKKRYRMDNALEDKICDLYDLYIEGLEEDAGPQVRKLYSELATYWPNGIIDNHGIKRAICRAKDRRKALYNQRKEREKIGRSKVSGSKVEVPCGVETPILAQPVHTQERSAVNARDHVSTSANKPVPNTEAVNVNANANAGVPMPERVKGSSSSCSDMPKKKAKRKPESELNEGEQRAEKMSSSTQAVAENKCQKPLAAAHVKPTFQPVGPPSFGPLIS